MKILRIFFANFTAEIAVQISLNSLRGEISIQTKNRELEKILKNLLSASWSSDTIKNRGVLDESEILWKIENQVKNCSLNGFKVKQCLTQNL